MPDLMEFAHTRIPLVLYCPSSLPWSGLTLSPGDSFRHHNIKKALSYQRVSKGDHENCEGPCGEAI